jgi:hypothetical protein
VKALDEPPVHSGLILAENEHEKGTSLPYVKIRVKTQKIEKGYAAVFQKDLVVTTTRDEIRVLKNEGIKK